MEFRPEKADCPDFGYHAKLAGMCEFGLGYNTIIKFASLSSLILLIGGEIKGGVYKMQSKNKLNKISIYVFGGSV